jgi:S1-C subfamily serine protease
VPCSGRCNRAIRTQAKKVRLSGRTMRCESMKLSSVLVFAVLPCAYGQADSCSFQVVAQLVDKNLDLKPIPKLKVFMRELVATRSIAFSTGFDGRLQGQLPCGEYVLTTNDPIEFDNKKYSWELKVNLAVANPNRFDLSVDNASIEKVVQKEPTSSGRLTDSLAVFFKKYEPSIVTVWSELGHGTGFFIDESGLILTNQHVIGPSGYIAVQSDPEHKVRAVLLASDPEKDVAILWVDRSSLPETVIAPLATYKIGEVIAIEGERVFTIGNPLSQRKIMTTGIVSKVEERAIISDININPGNSGGPLFNSVGTVIGLTTFSEHSGGVGPGISGIVRIEQVEQVLASARAKMNGQTHPAGALLPVEPKQTFPISALKTAVSANRFDVRPYVFDEGDYNIAILTPVLKYRLSEGGKVEAAKEKAKRHRSSAAAAVAFQPLDELHNWAEYAGQYQAVIQIRASPKLRETMGSALMRGLTTPRYGVSSLPAKLRFKADFYRMVLRCGDKEIEPIHPGKIAKMINVKDRFVNATDATYEGLYTYPSDAISPNCGEVSLDIFSEKDVVKAKVKSLSKKTVARVWEDTEPTRSMTSQIQ